MLTDLAGFRVQGLGVQGLGFRGLGFRGLGGVSGSGFRVLMHFVVATFSPHH